MSRNSTYVSTGSRRRSTTVEHFREHFLDVFDTQKANARLDALRHVLLDVCTIRLRREDRLDAHVIKTFSLSLPTGRACHTREFSLLAMSRLIGVFVESETNVESGAVHALGPSLPKLPSGM